MRSRTGAGTVVAAGVLALAGCGTVRAVDTTPVDTSPAAAAPNAAVCNAARALVSGAQATFAADATASDSRQTSDANVYYTQLTLVFSENGGSDPLSSAVAQDADKLSTDYIQLQAAEQAHDLDRQGTVLAALKTDLDRMVKDQGPFDAACGIPQIVPS